MKTARYFGLMILFLFMTSLSKNKEIPNEFLYQKWVLESYENETKLYKCSSEFEKDKFGIEFFANGKFLIRQNSGFCATPITFEIVEGKWSKKSENEIELDYKFWGGKIYQNIKIIELTQNRLKTKLMSELKPETENDIIIEKN